jgi:hypothetical protein
MHILHHCNHEPALSARIEKTYLGNVDNKMKTRLSKSPEDAAKQFSFVLPRYKSHFHNTAWVDFPALSMGNRGLVCFHGQTRAGQRRRNTCFLCGTPGRLSKTREDVKTMFEFGELDDYVSFGGKA